MAMQNKKSKNFLKVWRMPDLQQKFNDDILYRVCQKAGIKLDTHIPPLNRAVSDPRPYSIPRQKKRTGSGHGYKPGPGQLGLYSPGSRRACMNGSSEHYSTDSGIVQSSGGYNDDDDDNTSEASSLPYSRQPSYSTVPEERESSPSSPYYPTSSQSNSSHSSISPHKHPLSSSTTASYPASPHPTSSEPKEQTRTKQSHQGQIVTARLGKLNLYSNQSSVSESSDSLQPQLLEPNAQVSLPSGSSKSLGMGLYGEVLEVVYKGYHYAAKEYRKDFICGNELKKKISEKLISLKLKHENIVIYCGVAHIRGTDRSVLVMEKVHKNLETVLEDRTRELQSATKISILSNIADGLNYLHSFGIIHCNLIPTNILLTRELKAKISDYGNALVRPIATTVTEGRQDTAVLNDYLPQEALDGGPCNEPSLDTFSFGHLSLYVILQQKPHPLKGYFFKQNGKRVARSEVERREDYLNQMKKNISGGLLEWIKQCLDDDPSLRPQLRKFNFSPNFISN